MLGAADEEVEVVDAAADPLNLKQGVRADVGAAQSIGLDEVSLATSLTPPPRSSSWWLVVEGGRVVRPYRRVMKRSMPSPPIKTDSLPASATERSGSGRKESGHLSADGSSCSTPPLLKVTSALCMSTLIPRLQHTPSTTRGHHNPTEKEGLIKKWGRAQEHAVQRHSNPIGRGLHLGLAQVGQLHQHLASILRSEIGRAHV